MEHAGVSVRKGSLNPLVVRYAVDEVRRIVYVLAFFLLSGPGH